MELKAALRRVGATVAQDKVEAESATIYLRVNPDQGEAWVDAVSRFLFAVEPKQYTADVSKYFFVAKGEVKYLWRIVLRGKVEVAIQALANSAMESAMARAPEITSMPLVGRVEYQHNPAAGKLKGVHSYGAAEQVVGAALGGNPGVA